MDSGIIKQVDSTTVGESFYRSEPKNKLCMRSSWVFRKDNKFDLRQMEFEVLGDIQEKMLRGNSYL